MARHAARYVSPTASGPREAAKEGMELHFERQRRAPNTLLAHRTAKLAADPGAALEALFAAHFVDGEDIGDRA